MDSLSFERAQSGQGAPSILAFRQRNAGAGGAQSLRKGDQSRVHQRINARAARAQPPICGP